MKSLMSRETASILHRTLDRGFTNIMGAVCILVIVGLLSVFGCSPTHALIDTRLSRQILWPGDPERAVIEYLWSVRAISSPAHGKGLVNLLAGGEEMSTQDPRDSAYLLRPYGVFVDEERRLYITDTGAARVVVVDLQNSESFDFYSAGDWTLKVPLGIAVGRDGRIYVADAGNGAVFIFGPDGKYLDSLRMDFGRPVGVAIDEDGGRLYVSDALAHVVYAFSLRTGELVKTIGGRGSDPGRFNYPTHIFLDRQGRLYVCDALNFRIQVFDPTGRQLLAIGELGALLGNLEKPKGVAVDSEGHIYVVDTIQDKVKIFNNEGQLLLYFGEKGNNIGEFWLPSGIFIDGDNTIYVADTYHGRVAAFRFTGKH